MARKTQKIDTTQNIKMQKIVKLKNYLDAQEQVLFKLYTDAAEKVNYREDDKVKKMRKVYETLESFSMNVYSEEFKVEIEWFDGFNGDILLEKSISILRHFVSPSWLSLTALLTGLWQHFNIMTRMGGA